MKDKEDKIDCFARINEHICNALNEKKCENCSFYKSKDQVKNYSVFIKKGKKELLGNNK